MRKYKNNYRKSLCNFFLRYIIITSQHKPKGEIMKRALARTEVSFFHFVDGVKVNGSNKLIRGDLSDICGNLSDIHGDLTDIRGDLSGIRGDLSDIRGDLTDICGDLSGISGDLLGIRGDLTGIRGNLSGICGDIDECEISVSDRKNGIFINDLIKEK
jgi:hypothetical protein